MSTTLPVRTLLTQCVPGKGQDDYVFTREDGRPVRDFRVARASACEGAKVPGLLFHICVGRRLGIFVGRELPKT